MSQLCDDAQLVRDYEAALAQYKGLTNTSCFGKMDSAEQAKYKNQIREMEQELPFIKDWIKNHKALGTGKVIFDSIMAVSFAKIAGTAIKA